MRWQCAIFGAALCFLLPETLGDAKMPSERPFFAKDFLLGAHRGGGGLWPEDTLTAFKAAAAAWPDVLLETDARLTADGQVVLMHDDEVDRTTNGSGPLAGKTLAELKALDAGYRFTRDHGRTFPFRGQDVRIPTLTEVLEALPKNRFLVELKHGAGLAEATIDIIRRAGALDRVALASFDPALMAAAQRHEPSLIRCYDLLEGLDMLRRLRGAEWPEYHRVADILAVGDDMLDELRIQPGELRAIRDKGIAVMVHTINDPAQMSAFIDMGVDSILTDYPDRLADVKTTRPPASGTREGA